MRSNHHYGECATTEAGEGVTDIATWLLAIYGEQERVARAATQGHWRGSSHVDFPYEPGYLVYRAPADGGPFGSEGDIGWQTSKEDAAYIALHDPATVLADIAAKKAIAELHKVGEFPTIYGKVPWCSECYGWPCRTLRLLASAHADRPGYQQEWAAEL